MKRVALRCNASTLLISFFKCRSPTAGQYSNLDLIKAMSACSRNFMGQPDKFLHRRKRVLLHLLVMSCICLDHCKSLLRVTPRYLASEVCCYIWPHFPGLNCIPHKSAHCCNLFKSLCRASWSGIPFVLPFLKTRATRAFFQSEGKVPELREEINLTVRIGAISLEASLSKRISCYDGVFRQCTTTY